MAYVSLDVNVLSNYDLQRLRLALVAEVENADGDTRIPRIAECVASIVSIDARLRNDPHGIRWSSRRIVAPIDPAVAAIAPATRALRPRTCRACGDSGELLDGYCPACVEGMEDDDEYGCGDY